jgi:GntR family transcriptional repressor for pyruvate dehydrogenase complex
MARFRKVTVRRVSDTIVEQIQDLILQGELQPGDRLPPERELAERLQVSRPSLREAIGVMEAKGMLQVRRGGGTYVRDVMEPSVTDPLLHLIAAHPETVGDVLELRHALEETAAYHAAQRATDADLGLIESRLAVLEAIYATGAASPAEEAAADAAFHLAIADAAHNPVLSHVMRSLLRVLEASSARSFEALRTDASDHAAIMAQHRRLLDTVAGRDPRQARDAARQHLQFVRDSVVPPSAANGAVASA